MRIPVLMLALASLAPAKVQQPHVEGPRVLVVGSNAAGAARATYTCSGFGGSPVVDVHTDGGQGRIRDLEVRRTGAGSADFAFTLEYDFGTTTPREVWIVVTGGTGKASDGHEKVRVEVRRARF